MELNPRVTGDPVCSEQDAPSPPAKGRLLRKYIALFVAVVSAALISNTLLDSWFLYGEQKTALFRTQDEQARAAAVEISHFLTELVDRITWTTDLPFSDLQNGRLLDARRLLRVTPPVAELVEYDASGIERLRVSRVAPDVVNSGRNASQERTFTEAVAKRVFFGPTYFKSESEPYITISVAGTRAGAGVVVAEVNLKHILDVLTGIKVGESGRAYLVDLQGRLIGHPDITLVLRRADMSHLQHVKAGLSGSPELASRSASLDLSGQQVLASFARVPSVDWLIFLELPVQEAYAPLFSVIRRSGLLLIGALGLVSLVGFLLARGMVRPIRALQVGAERIGRGDLGQRLSIKTGDELEVLGDQFNRMAAQLQTSYATLEEKVEQRTRQLELANLAKSRFLATASHDLRQPLHALGLFVAQLRSRLVPSERRRVIDRIDASVTSMNELFNDLLDISKLDAGVLSANFSDFPIAQTFARLDSTFTDAARARGITLRFVGASVWVSSDTILLDRILSNLISNAVRYTNRRELLVGCRRHGAMIRVDVLDRGPGIPSEQQQSMFGEFVQLPDPARDYNRGLGLGLAIVDRLCSLLNHPIELASVFGTGSRFSVILPRVQPPAIASEPVAATLPLIDICKGKVFAVIDDDAMVVEGMAGLLRGWGAQIIAAQSAETVLAELSGGGCDMIICDYHLTNGETGIDTIERLRAAFGPVPAFLITGDTSAARLRQARSSGYHLLYKPVSPMTLRTTINSLLSGDVLQAAANL